MRSLPPSIDVMLKGLVCNKVKIPHMTKTVYDPSCMRYCSDLCGVRCRDLCNKEHTDCSRGILQSASNQCPSSSPENLTLDFISYETKDVETFGKGKPFTRMEKIATSHNFDDKMVKFKTEFEAYGEHTLSYWFLRATKHLHLPRVELTWSPSQLILERQYRLSGRMRPQTNFTTDPR